MSLVDNVGEKATKFYDIFIVFAKTEILGIYVSFLIGITVTWIR
jgi:hypothetical protein